MTMAERGFFQALMFGLLLATPSLAADGKPTPNWANPAPVYKDLPGVVSPEALANEKAAEQPTCTTAIEYRRWRRDDILSSDSVPVTVYRCEKNGITYSSTEMPDRPWVPGLNPTDLPRY